MKKILTLALAALMIASSAVVANANPANSHTITAAYGTPVVDGQMDDIWNNAEMQVQDSFRSGTETDAKAQIRVMYDDNYVYVLEYVPDNTLWTSDLTLANYQYDTTEVCISLTNSDASSYDGVFDWWVGITPYGVRNTDSNCTPLIGGGTDVNDAEYLTVHTSLENDPENDTAEGYWVEWAFNVKAIDEELVMDEGTVIGMEISVNDNAEYNNRTMCMGWADTTDAASGNPSTFGNVVFGAKGAAPAAEAAPAAAEGEPVLTIDFAEGAGDVELVNAEIVKDSERGNVLQVNGVGTSQTGARYGLLKTDVFKTTNWDDGMSINMWIKTADSSTLHGTAPIFSLDIANVGYIALTTSLESAINTDGNDTTLGIAPRIWTDPANVGGGMNMTETDTWQFISVVYNEDHIDLYVDGELYSDHPFANGNATDMSAMINLMIESEFVYSVRLGSWLCSWWKYGDYEGCIDDFTVYNKILSADEVKALYEATKDVEVPAEEPVAEEATAAEEPVVEEPAAEEPVVEEVVEEVVVEEPVVEEVAEEVVVEEPVVEEVAEEVAEEAAQTFDFGVIAAAAALISAAGYALSKKR